MMIDENRTRSPRGLNHGHWVVSRYATHVGLGSIRFVFGLSPRQTSHHARSTFQDPILSLEDDSVSAFEFPCGSTPAYIPSSARNPCTIIPLNWLNKQKAYLQTSCSIISSGVSPRPPFFLFPLASRHPQPPQSFNAMKLQYSRIFRKIALHSS